MRLARPFHTHWPRHSPIRYDTTRHPPRNTPFQIMRVPPSPLSDVAPIHPINPLAWDPHHRRPHTHVTHPCVKSGWELANSGVWIERGKPKKTALLSTPHPLTWFYPHRTPLLRFAPPSLHNDDPATPSPRSLTWHLPPNYPSPQSDFSAAMMQQSHTDCWLSFFFKYPSNYCGSWN